MVVGVGAGRLLDEVGETSFDDVVGGSMISCLIFLH